MSDIRLAMQELDIIKKFTMKQRLLCTNYKSLLDPSSFRVTTASRQASFKFEQSKLEALINSLNDDEANIDRLLEEADSLAKATQSGVEVRQEDHGKAILAFTIVTVVFLPLSFVTSFLGMNTADIRGTNHTQSLFWAVSLPLTALIILVSLLIGFKGNDIQEFIRSDQWWKAGVRWKPGIRRRSRLRNGSMSDTKSTSSTYTGTLSIHYDLGSELEEKGSWEWRKIVTRIKHLRSWWKSPRDTESMSSTDIWV